ncbi:Stk1 family PASTA domain-containing Ser/Thr kinase [Naasia sp. SYSU D00948]|uniref:Stk1 family PASTA domain-containing Ser/Thr kinase n=1 Tax=Naasia sp. SYSU D00948 TaxID=2817379 RepID=UPI001FEDEB78|nr:Stk1 family PASTA domain-containing Ser/Thr kinase [Naasia sp. SYSU D00948]
MTTSTGPTTRPGADTRRMLAGRYQIGSLLGRGGMADVHLGTDTRLGRTVAIKLLKSSLANDPAFRTRFRQEAQSAARMAHPTIVRVFDAGEEIVRDAHGVETPQPFIVMEYVDGKLLKDIIAMGPLEPAEAIHIVDGILTALEYSHRAGVVHRDIKPGNIMITRTGQVKVMDFGIARAISDSSATVAQTTAILGTAQYFSPEQARGETVDARTDLYSTGVVLFEMLTGRPPFRGDTAVSVAYQHVSETPPTPSSFNPKVSPALDAVTLQALTKDRLARYQSAAEFREDVATAAAGQVPTRRHPAPDASAGLFAPEPADPIAANPALKQLAMDDDTLVRTQTRPPAVWIWAGILSVAVIVVSVVIWVFTLTPNQALPTVSREVPVLTGQAYNDAVAQLEKLQIQAVKRTEPSNLYAIDQVIRTDPGPGTIVSPDTTIDVWVSSGPTQSTVPSVVGLDQGAAVELLGKSKFVVGAITREHSPTVPEGSVLRTDPAVGTQVPEGTTVNVVVSDGSVEMPDVRNIPIAQARSLLEGPELLLRVSIEATTNCTESSDLVLTQSLAPGTVPQGSVVTLTYCNLPIEEPAEE